MDIEKTNELRAEDFLDSLMDYAPLGIISADGSGNITRANHLAKVLLQIGPGNLKITGRNLLDSVSHITLLHEKLSLFQKKQGKSFTTQAMKINDRYIIAKGVRIKSGFICIINDVSRLKEIETGSIQSIIAGQENERRRIAREIHDGIGPMLSYSKLELDAFMDEYLQENMDIPDEKLLHIRQTLDSITDDLRNLSHHLIPRLLEEFGLFSAFSNLITRLNNSVDPKVEFYCNFNSETRFNHDLELNLYRCGQELLQNSIKHARASEILVQLIKHDRSIILMVEDDGEGFEKSEINPDQSGIGLTNIDTRVRTLSGTLIIESNRQMGTSSSIEIPI